MVSGESKHQIPKQLAAAAIIVALEALALVAVALVLFIKTIAQTPDDVAAALLEAGMALLAAAILALCARGLARQQPGARSPVIVLQILALPVAYSLWFQADRTLYGAPILIAALATLYLLFTPPARQALNRQPD